MHDIQWRCSGFCVLQVLNSYEWHSKMWWRSLQVSSSMERPQTSHWAWGTAAMSTLLNLELKSVPQFAYGSYWALCVYLLFPLYLDWNPADQNQEPPWGQRSPEKGASGGMSVWHSQVRMCQNHSHRDVYALKCNFKVLVLYLSISVFVLLLTFTTVFWKPMFYLLLHYIYLITLVNSYFADSDYWLQNRIMIMLHRLKYPVEK